MNLPDGWFEVPLEAIVDILDSQRVPLNSDEREKRINGKPLDQLFPYYGATGQVGYVDDHLFDESLVLLGEDGVPFFDPLRHKAYRVEGKCWVNNHAHVLRAKPEVSDGRYIASYLNSFDYTGFVTGSTRLKLTQAAMRTIPVPLAPPKEQKRIADKLDALLARVDACRERLGRVPLILKRFRQAILSAATSGQLTEEWRKELGLQREWYRVHIAEIGELGRGKSRHRPRNDSRLYGGSHPFIQTGDVAQSGGIINSHTQTYSDFGLAQSKLWPAGTVCITIAANIADTAILSYPACFPDSVVGFIANPAKCLPQVVKWAIDMIRADLEAFAPATAQKNINLAVLNDIEIELPPIDEQHEIVRRVETLFAFADRLEARYKACRAQVESMIPALLAKAFRGELVPQDPNDEPAETLLERIRATRAGSAPPRRTPAPRATNPIKRPTHSKQPAPLPLVAEPPTVYASNIPQTILAAMQPGQEHTRADILTATGIRESDWLWAIRQLKEEGKVAQTGERRGARYKFRVNDENLYVV